MDSLLNNDDALRVMLTMRSLIIAEFGISLSLHEHTPADFCAYGVRSDNTRMRGLTLQLAQITDTPLPGKFVNAPTVDSNDTRLSTESAGHRRMYRGQGIATASEGQSDTPGKKATAGRRFYRGLRVK